MPRILVVCSPHSGSACPPEEIVEKFRAAGVDAVEILVVSDLPEEKQGPSWHAAGYDIIVAAGGDGTVGAVVSHIGETELRLGILPLGTANDIARSIGFPLGLDEGIATVVGGYTAEIDVGEVVGADGRTGRFLHAAGLGLDAEFARLATDVERREKLGALNYPASALQALLTTRKRQITLRLPDGTVNEGPVLQLAALNTAHLFGSMGIKLPDIHPQDGQLTILVVRDVLNVERFQTRSVIVETTEPDDITVDGELQFQTPVTVRLAAKRLRMVVPAPEDSTLPDGHPPVE